MKDTTLVDCLLKRTVIRPNGICLDCFTAEHNAERCYQQSQWSRIFQLPTPVACKLYVTGSHSKSNNVLKKSTGYKVREGKKPILSLRRTVGAEITSTHRIGAFQWRLVSFSKFALLACNIRLEGLHKTHKLLGRNFILMKFCVPTLTFYIMKKLKIP
jgi:hypothetical protein